MLLVVNSVLGYVIISADFLLFVSLSDFNCPDSKVLYQILFQAGFCWESFH